ncbi:hypothetical protein HQ560_01340 [bacterium]|nr:hypothetical protein [bacterium]
MRSALLVLCSVAALAAEPLVQPASNTDPDGKVGKRPYEMVWAKRTPAHKELVDFEDLSGWTVAAFRGAKAALVRSREERMFGTYTAKVTYSGETAASAFELRPPKPIPIPGGPGAVQLWMRGNNWGWDPKPATARTSVTVIVRDAKGKQTGIPLGQVNFDYWSLMHRRFVPLDLLSRLAHDFDGEIWPLEFVAIRVSGCSDPKPAKLFFDSLQFYTFYTPVLADIFSDKKKTPPEPKLPPEKMPWPTTPETITPTPKEKVANSVDKRGKTFIFEAKGERDVIRWLYTPKTGLLDDLWVEVNGKRFQPCVGGGPDFELWDTACRPGAPGTTTKLFKAAQKGDTVTCDWHLEHKDGGRVGFIYALRPRGKSLQITFMESYIRMVSDDSEPEMDRSATTAFRIGRTRGTPDAELFRVPYLTLGNGPHLLHWDGVFLSAMLDPYNSDASTLFVEHGNPAPGEYILNGGSRYLPKTDGMRNHARERLILTVSTDVQEVLPHIPHPQSKTAHLAANAVWRNIGQPNRDLLKRLKARGVENFICPLHEIGWRDAGESFTFRLECAPRIGDAEMKAYGDYVKSLGYRFGLYSNYTDFAPVNGNWRENRVCLQSDGNWTRAWPRCYAPKPTYAWQAQAELAPKIAAKFGANTCYSDVHTSVFPWQRTDYDADAPGAGMFRTTWDCYAHILWNESKAYGGPVFSEGACQWLYAGISDGNYGQMGRAGAPRWQRPPLVDFDLLKMHPLMCDVGMGAPNMFYPQHDGFWRKPATAENPYLDRFITSTLAFGHIGYLALDWGFEGALKCYYMTSAVQQLYALVEVEEIKYFDGKTLLDTSAAIRTGAYKRGQVYIKYVNGLQLWCNLSFDHDWAVERYVIPPGGHLAAHVSERFVQYSARFDDRKRVDVVQSRGSIYLNNRGAWDGHLIATTRGSLAMSIQPGPIFRLIPSEPHKPLIYRSSGRQAWTVEARDADGKALGKATTRVGNLGTTIIPVKGAVSYILTPGARMRAPDADSALRPLVVGLDHAIKDFARDFVGSDMSIESVQVERVPDKGSAVDKRAIKYAGKPMRVHVPADAKLGELLWWRFRVKGAVAGKDTEQTLWFAGVASQAVDATLTAVGSAPQKPGSAHRLTLSVTSNLPKTQDVTVAVQAKGIVFQPASRRLALEEGKKATMHLEYVLPAKVGRIPVTLTFTHSRGKQTVTRVLRITEAESVVVDMARLAPTNTGMAFRGKPEAPLDTAATGAQFFPRRMRVGGVERQGFFCHPPYKTGTGYAFGEFALTLPEATCVFETWVGFQDGSSTTDGCVFSVQAKTEGTWSTINTIQHAKLKEWKPLRADLGSHTGRTIRLRLVTDVGPKNNSSSDWAAWGAPRVIRAGTHLTVDVTAD